MPKLLELSEEEERKEWEDFICSYEFDELIEEIFPLDDGLEEPVETEDERFEAIQRELHYKNGAVSLPASVLAEAVDLAIQHPPGEDAAMHPAIQHLCSLWNSHRSVPPKLRVAQSCHVILTEADVGAYNDVNSLCYSLYIDAIPAAMKECSAVVGECALVVFLKQDIEYHLRDQPPVGEKFPSAKMTFLMVNDNKYEITRFAECNTPVSLGRDTMMGLERDSGFINRLVARNMLKIKELP